MKITNSIIYDLLLVNKPPGISLWRAYLPSIISLIPLIYFSYKALLCIGYKKIDFKLRKKITSYGLTRRRIIGRRMEVILFRFVILFGIIFFIYTNYVSNEVAKITEQPELKPIPQEFKPYEGEIIPLDETKQVQTSPSPKAVNNYPNLLSAHIAKYTKYPRIAQRRKIEGEVIIEIQIRGDGSLISKYIKKSSGHEILDKAAMNTIERSKPFPLPPQASKDSVTTVNVPFDFNLQ